MKAGPLRSLTALLGAALFLNLALSCASSKKTPDPAVKLRTGISENVADPARAARMLAAVDEIEAAVGELDTLVAKERASLVTLLRDYSSSQAALDASLAEFTAARESVARRALAAHAAFKADVTALEWKKLRKLEMEMLMFVATSRSAKHLPGRRADAMLWALLGVLFFSSMGGGGFGEKMFGKDTQAVVREVVPDQARADVAIGP